MNHINYNAPLDMELRIAITMVEHFSQDSYCESLMRVGLSAEHIESRRNEWIAYRNALLELEKHRVAEHREDREDNDDEITSATNDI